jgi:hypothetical protein
MDSSRSSSLRLLRLMPRGSSRPLASFLLAEGNNPVLIKNLLRWSKVPMLDVYGHVMTDEKIAAQGSMLERIMPKTVAVQ